MFFVKNWQNRTLRDAFLGLGVFLLVFSIGWAMTGSLSYAVYPDAWKTPYFNHDTLSLVLLSVSKVSSSTTFSSKIKLMKII
jgi:hypothetical protein